MAKKRSHNYITRESWNAIVEEIIYIVESNNMDYDAQGNRLADYLEGEGIIEIGSEDNK